MIFSIVCEIVFITLLAVSQSQIIKLELKGDLFAQPGGGFLTYSWDVSKQPKVTDPNCEISKGEQPAGIILKTEFKLTSPNNWKFPDYTFVINWSEDSAKAPQITWNDLSPVRTEKINSPKTGQVRWIFIAGNLHKTEMLLTYTGKKGGDNKLPVKKCKKKPTPKTTPTTSNSLNKLIDILLQQYAKQYTTTPTTPHMGGLPVGWPYRGTSAVGLPYHHGTSAVGLPYHRGTSAVGLPYHHGTSAVGLPYHHGTSAVGLPYHRGTSAVGLPYHHGTSAVGLPYHRGTSAVGLPYHRGTSAVGLPYRGGSPSRGGSIF